LLTNAIIALVRFCQVVALNSPNGADVPLRTYSTNHRTKHEVGQMIRYRDIAIQNFQRWHLIEREIAPFNLPTKNPTLEPNMMWIE